MILPGDLVVVKHENGCFLWETISSRLAVHPLRHIASNECVLVIGLTLEKNLIVLAPTLHVGECYMIYFRIM